MNILLTLGRLSKGLELARALSQSGHRVIIADPFNWHLSKPSRRVAKSYRVTAPVSDLDQYLDDLLGIIDRDSIDLVIPVSEEALFTSRIGPKLPERTKLFGPAFEQMDKLHDKLGFARLCHAIGLSAPETYPADSAEAVQLAQRSDFVIKPIHGCSGIGVRLKAAGDPLTATDVRPSNLIQQRLYGRQISSFSIVQNGEVQATALYEGDIYLGTVSIRFRRVEGMAPVHDWIARFAAAEAYSGFLSLDFFVSEDGLPSAIECNPRLTSGIHLLHRDLIAARVTGAETDAPTFKRHKVFQDAHAAMTVAVGNITRPLTYLKILGKVLTTKDVMFDWRDPLPFLLMTPMSWDTIRQGLFEGIPLADAVTRDILWQGDEAPESHIQQGRVSLDDAAPER